MGKALQHAKIAWYHRAGHTHAGQLSNNLCGSFLLPCFNICGGLAGGKIWLKTMLSTV